MRCRPQRYTNAAPSRRTAAPPIAIPAIAPVESGGCEPEDAAAVAVVGVAVTVAVVGDAVVDVEDGAADLVDSTSAGKFSPGLKAIVELCANACWTSSVWVEFGLITPTIPFSSQAPGAEQ